MGRSENIAIFEDTRNLYKTNPELVTAIQESNQLQEVILESDTITKPAPRYEEPARIMVSKSEASRLPRSIPYTKLVF